MFCVMRRIEEKRKEVERKNYRASGSDGGIKSSSSVPAAAVASSPCESNAISKPWRD